MLLHLLREKMLLPREWTLTKLLLLNMKILIWIRVIPKDNFTIPIFSEIPKNRHHVYYELQWGCRAGHDWRGVRGCLLRS